MSIEEIKIFQYIKNKLRNPDIAKEVIRHIKEDSILKQYLDF